MKKRKQIPAYPIQPANEISRTRKKKDALHLQKLGERLAELNDAQLNGFDLGEELRQAVRAARTMKSREARRRQLQYIGSLMRHADAGPIEQKLEDLAQGHSLDVRRFKQIEQWRDQLLQGDAARLQWLVATFPRIERDKLAGLVKEASDPSLPEHLRRRQSRALFRYLGQCVSE